MRLALFDLDGTLIDSERGIAGSMRHAFAAMGHESPPRETLRSWIGPPLRQTFPHVVGDDHDRIEQAVAHYRERFDTLGWAEHDVYAGIEDVVRAVHATRCALAIVTTKVLPQASRIVAHLPFGDCFARIYGPGLDGRHCEKSDMIATALRDFGIAAAEAVMIGDRHFDIEGARANGVRAIGVRWGFGSIDELREAGADALAESPGHLAALLGVDHDAITAA
jgi:phosphoglycolate phosphatase